MDISKDFKDSFELLKNNKKIIIPALISICIPLIVILIFLNASGSTSVIKDYVRLSNQFDEQKVSYLSDENNFNNSNYSVQLINYLGKKTSDSEYEKEMLQYFKDNNFDFEENVKKLMTLNNLFLLISLIIISFILMLYFSCMSFTLSALVIKKERLELRIILKETTFYFIKFFSLTLLLMSIVIIPIIMAIVIMTSLFLINLIVGILFAFLIIMGILAYIVYISFKIFFSTPIMFMDKKGAIDSTKISFHMTKGHVKQVIILFIITYALTIFINGFVQQPLYQTYSTTITNSNIWMIILSSILVISLIIIESIGLTFERLFIFNAYLDFKDTEMSEIKKEKIIDSSKH